MYQVWKVRGLNLRVRVSILPFSTMFILDFGTVLTEWYCWFFSLLLTWLRSVVFSEYTATLHS